MKVLQIVGWVVIFLLLVISSSFAHCGKNHNVQVEDMTQAQLQQKLAEAEITSETLMLEKMLRAKDEQRSEEKKEKEEKSKRLDELVEKLKKDR
jgi:phosphosulfolactate phosphohydrolase-like enzyme